VPTFSVRLSRLTEPGFFPVAPCGVSEHRSSPLSEPSLEPFLEHPGVEHSVTCKVSNVESIKSPRVLGELSGPPDRAPMPGKAIIQLGGRLVSQRAQFETDSPTAIHPVGTALTP
jgi:hypothetical protein